MRRVLIFMDLSAEKRRMKLKGELFPTDKEIEENNLLNPNSSVNVIDSDPIVIIDVDGIEYKMTFKQFKNYCKDEC